MRKRWIIIPVVLAGLLAADVAARTWAEAQLRDRAAAYYPAGTAASAQIRSFPFLVRLLGFGAVGEVAISMRNLRAEEILVTRLRLEVDDVELSRSDLFRGKVRLVDVGSASVEALLDGASVARATEADIRFSPGRVEVHRTVDGVDVFATGTVTIEDNVVRFRPESVQGGLPGPPLDGFALTYRIPGDTLIDCDAPTGLSVDGGFLVSCTVNEIPASLLRAAQRE